MGGGEEGLVVAFDLDQVGLRQTARLARVKCAGRK
jgi:hypothetical protein